MNYVNTNSISYFLALPFSHVHNVTRILSLLLFSSYLYTFFRK